MKALNLKDTDYKVGDIIVGTTYWGCTTPHFFKIVGMKGKKTLLVQSLPCAYDSKYGSNSPYYECVPDEYDPNGRFVHFEFALRWADRHPPEEARVYTYHGDDTFVKVGKGKYGTILCDRWDGTPRSGNCD